jgi:5-methyltetrahydrofolate--homocysteine methyltransferase
METILSSKKKMVVISPDNPFVIIGERINPAGRKMLASEMEAGNYERVVKDALAQVQAGAIYWMLIRACLWPMKPRL